MRGEYLNILKQLSEKKTLTEAKQEPSVYSNYFVGWVVSKLSIDPMALKDETIESIADEFVSEMSVLVGPEIEEAELNLPELKTIVTNYTQKAIEANKDEEGDGEENEKNEDGEKKEGEEKETSKTEENPASEKKENPFAKKDEKNKEEGKKEEKESSGAPKAPKSTKTECATSLSKIKAPKPVKLTSEVKGPKPYKK